MIIVMASHTSQDDVDQVVEKIQDFGYRAHVIVGVERTVIAAVGDDREKHRLTALEALPHVEQVVPILKPFKLAGKEVRQEPTIVECKGVKIGGGHFAVIAGPCAVESREQIMETAKAVKDAGAKMLRGGAYKPRTSPYSFQGMEVDGLKLLQEAGAEYGLPVVTEVMAVDQVEVICKYADMLQVGARNMQNFGLLRAVGQTQTPVFLKRGMSATIQEFLMSAEYIMAGGNRNVIMCERGIRTFETETRNTLDIQAVPVLNKYTHLPVVIDPSHSTGHWDLVPAVSKAAVAVGANGLMIEVHPNPAEAMSDGPQSLKPNRFATLMQELEPLLKVMNQQY